MRHTVNTPIDARPEGSTLATPVRRVMVGTDRSETADQAVRWAASLADRCGAELIVVQIIVSQSPAVTEYGAAVRSKEFGERFYANLFKANPEVRSLFQNDLAAQTKMLVFMLTSLVKGLNRLHEIEGGLRELGKRHRDYN